MNNRKVFENQYDRFNFLQDLEEYSVIFSAVYKLGNAIYTNSIDTLCVLEHNGSILYLINYDFFWNLNDKERLFVVCHEALHIYFNHLEKIKKFNLDMELSNIVMDIVINETLFNHFAFKKEEIPIHKKICLIENIFTPEQIEKYDLDLSKGFQYFYDVLLKERKINKINFGNTSLLDEHTPNIKEIEEKLKEEGKSIEDLGSGDIEDELLFDNEKGEGSSDLSDNITKNSNGSNENQENRNSDSDNSDINNDTNGGSDNLDKSNDGNYGNTGDSFFDDESNNGNIDKDFSLSEISESFTEMIKNNIEQETNKNLDILEEILDGLENSNINYGDSGEGYINLNDLMDNNYELFKVKESSKWKKIIKFVNPSILEEVQLNDKSFAKQNLPLSFVLNQNNIFLPGYHKKYEFIEDKIDLYFFFDISGSCISYQEDFLDIVSKIPTSYFNLHLYTFDTKVNKIEIDYKKKKFKTSIKVGGGTSFDILEKQIQKDLKNRVINKYPDCVCVLTDGYASPVKNIPEKKQNRWLWLLTIKDNEEVKYLQFILNNKIIPFFDTNFDIHKPKINRKIKKGCKIMPISSLKNKDR